ncbi:MAG: hypothetical protein IAG10_16580 [Planctomycetaceae bacterium]|nr:hypothetical protein [Planctomycetaceae bacterium]
MMGAESGNLYGLFSLGSVVLGIITLIIGSIMMAVANAARDKLVKEAAKAAKR